MQKCFGIHPPLISDQTTIKKTVWRSFCSKVGLVKSSAMGASDLYSPGVKVMIKRKRHKFYGGLGTIMTKPLNKKAAFRVFMVDAATTTLLHDCDGVFVGHGQLHVPRAATG